MQCGEDEASSDEEKTEVDESTAICGNTGAAIIQELSASSLSDSAYSAGDFVGGSAGGSAAYDQAHSSARGN
eukprot:10269034-Lingulodinium_polyedra.AAC.1